jgi:Flp pilus assembly protein TadG
MTRLRARDERGLIGKAAVTIMVLVVVGGLASIDGGSILLASLQISDTADTAAAAAASEYAASHDVRAAKQAAIGAAHQRDPASRVSAFSIQTDGTATVTVRKVASTLFARRIGFLKHFAVVSSTSTASP